MGGETLIADIKQLPAAHYMEVSLGSRQETCPSRYWQVDLNQHAEISFNEAADRLRELFLESVHLHLRSDVPIGVALSGGIDSSSIVMAMHHLQPDIAIHAFSYVADEPSISEERWVDLVGQTAKATIHKVRTNPNELLTDLDALISSQEEAFVCTNMFAQRRVFRQTGEAGIKVMLNGQGADELLGGYYYYIAARLVSLLRQGKWAKVVPLLRGASSLPGMGTVWLWLRAIRLFDAAKLTGSSAPFD